MNAVHKNTLLKTAKVSCLRRSLLQRYQTAEWHNAMRRVTSFPSVHCRAHNARKWPLFLHGKRVQSLPHISTVMFCSPGQNAFSNVFVSCSCQCALIFGQHALSSCAKTKSSNVRAIRRLRVRSSIIRSRCEQLRRRYL